MKTKLLLVLALIPFIFAGCDDGGGTVVVVEDGVYYEPATIENNSYDEIIISSAIFGDIFLPPGSAVDLDVGPNVDRIFVYINGVFFEEIYIQSGDLVVFE